MCILVGMAELSPGQRAAAERFKAARLQNGFSQRRLAKAAGVAVGVIQNFESHITWPDDLRRARLEPAVGLPAGELDRIADDYAEHGGLIDEETALTERLAEVQRLQREGLTQGEADLLLQRQLIVREFFERRVELLRLVAEIRRALDDEDGAEARRLTDEIESRLRDGDPI